MADKPEGTPFGRYQLLERVAMGGMAEVFRARVTGPDGFEKDLCIKRILPQFCEEEDFVRMFIDEAKVAARLQHANIVQVFDFSQVDGAYFIAMEYVAGKDLRAVIKQGFATRAPPGPYRAASIVAEMCRGLHHAHQKEGLKLVHRDVSPHNVMISMGGEVKVMDFGIAKATDRITKTSTGIIKGKIAYMAPEQAGGGEIDHRVDQFATGLVLFELLTGRRAYDGPDPTALRRALEGEVEPPSLKVPDVPPELDEIFLKACARDPAARYPDMRALERALQGFIYKRAPDDDELDLGRYMLALFGKAARTKTAVLVDTKDLAPPPSDPRHVSGAALAAQATAGAPPALKQGGATGVEVTLDLSAANVFASMAPQAPQPRPAQVTDATATAMGTPTPMMPPTPEELAMLQKAAQQMDGEKDAPPVVKSRRPLWLAGAVAALVLVGVGSALVSTQGGTETPRDPVPAVPLPPADKAVVVDEKPVPKPTPPAEKEPAKAPEQDVERAPIKGAKGHVKVVTSSGWAQVWLRGKMVLEETPGDITLDPGKYMLVLKNPENGRTQNVSVVVRSKETTRVVRPAP